MCKKKPKDKLEIKGNDYLQGWMEMVQGIDKRMGFLRIYLFLQFDF